MRRASGLAAMCVTGVLASGVHAESVHPPTLSLKGLHTLELSFNNMSGWEAFDEAFTVIEPQVARRFREAGLRVFSEHDGSADLPQAVFEVAVHAAKARGSLRSLELSGGPDPELSASDSAFVFLVVIRVVEKVRLSRDRSLDCEAATWTWTGWLQSERKRPFKALRQDVLRGVDDFLAEWRRVRAEP